MNLIGSDDRTLTFTDKDSKYTYRFELGLKVLKTNHQIMESSGLIIYDRKDGQRSSAICITGDTKAHTMIEQQIRDFMQRNLVKDVVIFHDYSAANYPSRNPHACDSDIETEYSDAFRHTLNYYHHGGDFYHGWMSLDNDGKLKRFTYEI